MIRPTYRIDILNTVDIVHDPSAPESFVNGIMEGMDYVVGEDDEIQQMQEDIKDLMHNTPKTQRKIAQAAAFRAFINKVALKQ